MKAVIRLNVNGVDHELFVPLHKTLLEVIREELGLTGTKHGCELIDTVADVAFKAAKPIDNTDMGPAYRKLMARVLTRRALRQLA